MEDAKAGNAYAVIAPQMGKQVQVSAESQSSSQNQQCFNIQPMPWKECHQRWGSYNALLACVKNPSLSTSFSAIAARRVESVHVMSPMLDVAPAEQRNASACDIPLRLILASRWWHSRPRWSSWLRSSLAPSQATSWRSQSRTKGRRPTPQARPRLWWGPLPSLALLSQR